MQGTGFQGIVRKYISTLVPKRLEKKDVNILIECYAVSQVCFHLAYGAKQRRQRKKKNLRTKL